jgi:hypothetical protein
MMIASIRHLDELVKQDGRWLFAERRLHDDWFRAGQTALPGGPQEAVGL